MKVRTAISTVIDGTMSFSKNNSTQDVQHNRTTFLSRQGITMDETTKVYVTYDRDDYCQYIEVSEEDKGIGMFNDSTLISDALITKDPNHALFLPLADCVGMVVYDSVQNILMVSHVGRHSLEQHGAFNSVNHMITTYHSKPDSLYIWLTPAPGVDNYPLYAFNNRPFKDVVFDQLNEAGISPLRITDNPADSTKDDRYFSHSEFLAGRREIDGRYSIVAVMRP